MAQKYVYPIPWISLPLVLDYVVYKLDLFTWRKVFQANIHLLKTSRHLLLVYQPTYSYAIFEFPPPQFQERTG